MMVLDKLVERLKLKRERIEQGFVGLNLNISQSIPICDLFIRDVAEDFFHRI